MCIFGASVCLWGAWALQDPLAYLFGGFCIGSGLFGVLLTLQEELTDDQQDLIHHFRDQNERLMKQNLSLHSQLRKLNNDNGTTQN
jgi:hypothetical protein